MGISVFAEVAHERNPDPTHGCGSDKVRIVGIEETLNVCVVTGTALKPMWNNNICLSCCRTNLAHDAENWIFKFANSLCSSMDYPAREWQAFDHSVMSQASTDQLFSCTRSIARVLGFKLSCYPSLFASVYVIQAKLWHQKAKYYACGGTIDHNSLSWVCIQVRANTFHFNRISLRVDLLLLDCVETATKQQHPAICTAEGLCVGVCLRWSSYICGVSTKKVTFTEISD